MISSSQSHLMTGVELHIVSHAGFLSMVDWGSEASAS